ncbi:hypothetical protein RES13_01275 [Staphylococcus cohnii]|uniref:hypothetical protein n=1 Tax=Staphylococcus cohnii TaxID=29382 RepID=UPI0008FBAB7D|nr:hypothetical protein [Staphylococcus cohnii]TGP66000.1 hypothetical protein EN872_00170 [bacterium M00.F.Ca.ET.229.01.1.1]TGS42249.1 hypothetical protein EN823_00170 [bacterium M00.F.Ca.ET.180.01.1.1]OIS36266.1 hypothetical protein RES11_07280 [Staphylococcus cohnii]OIS37183.1 hypothetical protein RES12_09260 [Staphylococcus cohnii]OIS40639.1 hypothetical protein RES13_01275 [Staphylococcus cohnii]
MKYYNRDDFERNLVSYEVPEYFTSGARNVFVYGFIVGAVIGSAVGLVSISKSRQSDKSVPKNKKAFKSNVVKETENDKAEAERQVAHIKEKAITNNELDAQKVAIQQETATHNLSNTSPQAQETLTEQKSSEASDDDLNNIDVQAQPTESEKNAQKNAIKQESETHHLSDSTVASSSDETSKNGTVSATKLANAAEEKNKALKNDATVKENTNALVAEENVKSNSKKTVPNLVTKSTEAESTNSLKSATVAGSITAAGLALAANQKRDAMSKDPKVAEKTVDLLEPETLTAKVNQKVPNLVTKKLDNAVENNNKVENSADKHGQASTNNAPQAAEQRVKQTHKSVSFKDGIIVHDNAEQGINKQSSSNNSTVSANSDQEVPTYSKNRLQNKKSEKAKSKIDKRTFND